MKKLFIILTVCALTIVAFGGGEVLEIEKSSETAVSVTKTVDTVEVIQLATVKEQKVELETQLERLEARYQSDKKAITNAIARLNNIIAEAEALGVKDE